MSGQEDGSSGGPKIYRLGLRVWLQQRTHPEEHDEWRGVVYDQIEPRLREAFRGLESLAMVVSRVIERIGRGDRTQTPPEGAGGSDADPDPERPGFPRLTGLEGDGPDG